MFSKILSKVGNVVFVFIAVLMFLLIGLIIEFDYVDFMYLLIVLYYFIKYLKLKLS